MKRKPKILMVGEFSQLSTGYAVYTCELFKRLNATGKYELAELACFANPDQAYAPASWKVYFNQPSQKSPEFTQYSSKMTNAFGEWSFEKVCLDFKPDIVIDIRDYWMVEFQERSPFRKYYNWVWMATIDAQPQNIQWISTFKNCDALLTYSDWSFKETAKYSGINLIGTAPPGVDLNTFQPIENKRLHKKNFGIPEDSFIIGTVMRNQKRKLFPSLIKAFSEFIEKAPEEIAKKTYLYLHTSYPDWWDIPKYLYNYGVTCRTYFSYKCSECKYMHASKFNNSRCFCPKCGNPTSFIPNTHLGISREELNLVYNTFDIKIQYANSEGFGMPQIEAGACGVPLMAVDYSAMADVVRKLNGYPIKVKSLEPEAETGCERAIPDNEDFIDKLLSFTQLPEILRKRKGFQTRKLAEKFYDWDKNIKVWEDYFDSIDLKSIQETWDSPVKLLPKHDIIPDIKDMDYLLRWLFNNIIERPDLCDGYSFLRILRDVQMGVSNQSTSDFFFNELSATGSTSKRIPFGRDEAVRQIMKIAENYNQWEIERGKKIGS